METGIAVSIFLLCVIIGVAWFIYWDGKQQKREQSNRR
jgi:cbb3-type cytochrome oxidase subunit 3